MTTDFVQPRPSTIFASPYFLFDAALNLIDEVSGEAWPVAVMAGLQACVRSAIAAGHSSFVPFGIGPRWCIVPVRQEGVERFAVWVSPPPPSVFPPRGGSDDLFD